MPFQSYRDLVVWQKAVDLTVDVYRVSRSFPRDERFGITSQIRRAAVSISNNIAEGHGRATHGEFLNALSSARGSTNEVENCLILSQRLDFAEEIRLRPLFGPIDEILRMLTNLRATLKR